MATSFLKEITGHSFDLGLGGPMDGSGVGGYGGRGYQDRDQAKA